MKKNLFFAAVALVALASCASDDYIGENNNSPNPVNGKESAIVFNSGANAMTRTDYTGGDAAALLNNNFVVYGIKSNATTSVKVFDHYNVNYVGGSANSTTSNTDGWEYVAQTKHANSESSAQTIKYWDYAMSQYDFIAYSSGLAAEGTDVTISKITPATMTSSTGGAYTIGGTAANLAKCYIADLKTAYRDATAPATSDYQKTVQFKFRSLSAKVRVALYETVPGYSVKDVVFYTDASTPATDGEAHLYTTGSDVFNEIGTYTVYYPTTGSGNTGKTDYNKAHLAFTPSTTATNATTKDKSFGSFAYDATNNTTFKNGEGSAAGTNIYLGRASNEATYAGVNTTANPNYYTVVIPNEEGAVLNLKVNYTLVSNDGSTETINVTGATALVPAAYASWKSGYAYTYLFKISHNSNGHTGIDPSTGNPIGPEGLYPITFDAVVMNSEVDGVQETITTVATPSITTYTKGKVVTNQSEYSTGANIYVVVNNGTALTVGTNAKLYTVTLADGAAQTLNEASIGNALKYGTDGTAGGKATKTVTDANGKALVVTAADDGLTAITEIAATDAPDGNAITVNGARFTPASAGNYVFAYRVSEGSATATTAAYDPTATYYSMTPTTGTGFYLEATPTAADIAAWDSNKSKYTTAPTQPVYAYKIIIVQ